MSSSSEEEEEVLDEKSINVRHKGKTDEEDSELDEFDFGDDFLVPDDDDVDFDAEGFDDEFDFGDDDEDLLDELLAQQTGGD